MAVTKGMRLYSMRSNLAIGRIFGGIPHSFFKTYHEYLPKSEPQDQYGLRGDLYELYPYLNHTVLFGVRRHDEEARMF